MRHHSIVTVIRLTNCGVRSCPGWFRHFRIERPDQVSRFPGFESGPSRRQPGRNLTALPWRFSISLKRTRGTGWTAEHFWILGTDISERALQVARTGLYSDWEIDRGITPEQKNKYFSPHGGQWLISPGVRKMVDFRRVNILQNVADLAGFDLVFCRNLLIYFDELTRFAVCQKIARSLNPDGLLLLGAAEHLPASYDRTFQQIQFGRTIAFVKLSAANSTG